MYSPDINLEGEDLYYNSFSCLIKFLFLCLPSPHISHYSKNNKIYVHKNIY